MPFPQTPLDVQIELRVGGVWTDITTDVYTAEKITIERGRPDEGQRADPGKCAMALNNRLGKYSPRNPISPYYGLIGRNTPIRVSVLAGSQFLRLPGATTDFASTPDAAPLDILGDLDVRMDAQLVNWLDAADVLKTTELVGKLTLAPGGKSWFLGVRSNRLYLEWSADGTNTLGASSTVELVVPPSGRLAVRATLDVDNGSGGRTVTFYTAPSGTAGPWTQLGAPVVQAGVTSIFNSPTAVRIGNAVDVAMTTSAGRCMAVEIRNGINGMIVANPDFTAQAIGATSFVDGAGRTWTLSGGTQITNRRTRFVGEVSSWPSRWDLSGKDVRVPIEAAGVLRRYGQGQKPFDSTLRRRIPAYSPAAYWPLEEAQGATQAYSPVPGVQPLKVSGGVEFASDDTLGGATTVPAWGEDGEGRGAIPSMPVGAWHCEMAFKLDAMPSGLNTMLEVTTTGTAKKYTIRVQTNNVNVRALDSDGAELALINVTAPEFTGRWNRLQLWARQQGADVEMHVAWVGIGASGVAVSTTYTATEGRPTQVKILGIPGNLRLGHLAMFSAVNTVAFANADDGFAGETAGVRLRRLASEEGKPILVHGNTAIQELMGAQKPDTFLDLVEEAADVDGGILYERRDVLSLAYRDRHSLYNQAPALQLDYNAPGLAHPLEPVDDDQAIRNDRTVQREGGSSARAVLEEGPVSVQAPPNGVGPYDDSVTLNLHDDDQPAPHAAWRLHLGTVDEARYPVVNVDLAAAPALIDAVTQLDSGDRLTIANPPAWLPPGPIDLIAQGSTEVIGHPKDWDFSFNCTPATPWRVGVLDQTAPRIDANPGGSLLAAAVDADDTELIVHTPAAGAASLAVPFVTSRDRLSANPDFEESLTGWTATGGTIDRVATPGPAPFSGDWSLLLTPNGVASTAFAASPAAPVTPGTAYAPYGFLRCASARSVSLSVNWYDGGGAYLSTSSISKTVDAGVWTEFTGSVTAPVGAATARVLPTLTGTPPSSDQLHADVVFLGSGVAGASARDFPFDVVLGGEVVRVTGNASALLDTFTRTVAGGWGTPDSGSAWTVTGAAADYSVGSGYGSVAQPTVGIAHLTLTPAPSADVDLYADVATSVLASGASLFAGPLLRAVDNNNHYAVRLDFTTTAAVNMTIRKRVAGVETQLGLYTSGLAHVAGTFYRVRFQAASTTLRAKVWPATAAEPRQWQIEVTDPSLTAAANIGTRSFANTGSTAVAPSMRFDNIHLVTPQRMTVMRSINGIVKPHAVGAEVRVHRPAVVAL
ncbi:hypothetical protein [Streptomyces sp. NPDC002779]|uniref:hypothetical protein n=1 Tax=Streptomyces sp. NPDC002779 TaxID=3364664 RepID=UPI0036C2B2FD